MTNFPQSCQILRPDSITKPELSKKNPQKKQKSHVRVNVTFVYKPRLTFIQT